MAVTPSSGPFLPLEIVRHVAEAAYLSEPFQANGRVHRTEDIGKRTKPSWATVAPLSAASKAYREIVLEIWFRTLSVRRTQELDRVCEAFPAVAKWTRILHCNVDLFDRNDRFNLNDLQNLQMLQLDVPMGAYTGRVYSPFELFLNVPHNLVEVYVNQANFNFQPQGSIFDEVERFPNLRVLGLRAKMTWCDLCSADEPLVLKKPAPEALVYEGVNAGLPMTIRKAISSLMQLEAVTFTSEVFSLADSDGTDGIPLDPNANPLFWSGECEHHVNALLRNQDLCNRWVKAKTGQAVDPEDEDERSSIQYCHLPSLKRVEWHFYTPEKPGSLVRTGRRGFMITG